MGCETVSLADIAVLIPGFSFKSKEFGSGFARAIKIGNISRGINSCDLPIVDTSKYAVGKLGKYQCVRGDYLVAMTGNTIGKIGRMLTGTAYANQRVLKVSGTDKVEPGFLWAALCTTGFHSHVLSHIDSHSAQPNISAKSIGEFKIELPDLATQKRISSVFMSIEEKIEVNNRLNGYLEELANAAFADWLKKHANGKEIASFVSDSDHLSLGELCSKVTDGSHSSPRNDPNGKYPMLSVRDMRRFGFDYASCKMISQIDFDAMTANDCVPKVDDILVAKDGSYLKEVFITNEEKNEAVLSSIAIFRPDKRIIAPEILLYFLKHPRTRKLAADNFVSGSALPRIVLKDFKKLTLLTPSRKEQEEILPILQIVRNLTWANVKGNERLVKLRDTLLPKLISGEIDVSKIDLTQLNSHLA